MKPFSVKATNLLAILASITCFGTTAVGAEKVYDIDPGLYDPNSALAKNVQQIDAFRRVNRKAAEAAQTGDCSAALGAILEAVVIDPTVLPFQNASKELRNAVLKSAEDAMRDGRIAVGLCGPGKASGMSI